LAIDLITKRHECSYLFYLADIVILFVGIPQGQSTLIPITPSKTSNWGQSTLLPRLPEPSQSTHALQRR